MSIKSLGKFAAIAAAAGLALTACADDSVSQARDQEETCGLIMGAEAKANESLQQTGMAMQAGGGSGDQAAQALESSALDVRNHSFQRSDEQVNPETGETVPLRTALQVHAAYLDEMADTMGEGIDAMQSFDPDSVEVEGTNLNEALDTINGYCSSYVQQQMQGQMPQQQMPQQQMPQGMPEEEAPAPEKGSE